MATCKKCGTQQNAVLYNGICDYCHMKSQIYGVKAKEKELEEKKRAAELEAREKWPGYDLGDKYGLGDSVTLHASPHVPPGQAFVFSGSVSPDGDSHVIAGADFLGKLVGSTLSPEELQAGMGILGKIDNVTANKIIERTAHERTRQIEGVREKIKMLLRPVVDDDMGDQELEGLANALMAAMAVLGGGDVMSLYGVSS